MSKLDKAITTANDRYGEIGKEAVKAIELLSTKQGEVELKDIIEVPRKEVQQILHKDIGEVQQEINRVEEDIAKRKAEMDRLTSRERSKEITDEFRTYMERFLRRLDVQLGAAHQL